LHGFAAAAIAGRLLGLDKLQMRNAFGLVLTQTSGTIQEYWDGTTSFKLLQGLPARNGIFAAELAKSGWTGIIDALQSRFGYYNVYTHGCTHPEIITKDLGKYYHTYSGYKRYPSGGPTGQAINSALEIFRKHDIKIEDIKEVFLYVNHDTYNGYYAKPWQIRGFPHGDAIFSLRYATATAMLKGHVGLEDYSEEVMRDPKLNRLIEKIKIEEMTEEVAKGLSMPVETKVILTDGREYSELFDKKRASARQMTKDDILAKYWYQVEFSKTVTRKNSQKLLSLLERLEELDNINQVVELMVK
jgi:2-methylcitrate dehydratase PrpD